jgi:hypothetical protein
MRVWIGAVWVLGCAAGMAQQALRPGPLPVMNEPYTADRTLTSYQKLSDGTTIEHHSTVSYARDSQGRTWSRAEVIGDPLRPPKVKQFQMTSYDPETRTSMTWCTCTTFATRTYFGEPKPASPDHQPGLEGMEVYLGPRGSQRLKYHAEELPAQVIEGMTTRGSKVVRTVPAGVDGNDHDLTTTIVSWYSPELKLALTTIIDDPVKGLSKYEFINLKRIEPNPALFLLPKGYMVREESGR